MDKPKPKRWKKILAIVVAAIVAAIAGGIIWTYATAHQGIRTVDDSTLSTEEPVEIPEAGSAPPTTEPPLPMAADAMSILIVGSDSRSGESWSKDGARADTTLVAHISADRSRVDVVSIPRDSMVSIPSCPLSSGGHSKSVKKGMFNSAFQKGDSLEASITCTKRTVEKNTGLTLDGFAVVDFKGFEKIVDALGGVEVNVPEDMKAKKAGLDLKKGKQTLDGKEALAFSRARTFEVGPQEGSDIERIERQKLLMGAIVKKVTSGSTLANPVALNKTLKASLDSATFSKSLGSVDKLANLGLSMSHISDDDVHFYTVPVKEWSKDHNRVVWTKGAKSYWKAMAADKPIRK